ncbi:MAG TPA: radical SAM protein [Actinomycetota bacterium]
MAMTKEMLPLASERHVSPEWVRISMASAIALRFRSGRFTRAFEFGGINLLLNYAEGCLSDCSYCGLARTRPGYYEEKSFIRVDWPLVQTDEFVDRLAKHEATLTRLCISMVTHGHSYQDTVDITKRIRAKVKTPLSILVAPPTLDRGRIEHFKQIGVDMIGVGLDAATEPLFIKHRTDVPQGGLRWKKYWEVIDDSREVFGPWKVNAHVLVGLGETDRELCDLFIRLCDREIFPYLFSFNPEPDSRLGAAPRAPLSRWRRIQLVKHLIEREGLREEHLVFDDDGALVRIDKPRAWLDAHVRDGEAFMTNGCPGPEGEPGCTRPYGSYRPSEPFRDFPFLPLIEDARGIQAELRLDELCPKE